MADNELKIETGIVGFFDILGYQSFLKDNTAEEATKEVLKNLNNLDSTITDSILANIEERNMTIAKKMLSEVDWLIFSDTILITYPYSKNDTDSKKELRWTIFFGIVVRLYSKMFEFGLPIRGAVGFGQFIKQKNCFAGIPIIETYQHTNNLELAGCILVNSAEQEISRLAPSPIELSELTDFWLTKYLVPFKDKNENSFIFTMESVKAKDDIRQFVLKSFWKHNKQISPSAHAKVENTEKFIRYLKFKNLIHI